MKEASEIWLKDVAPHDYLAAENFLSLYFTQDKAEQCVKRLKKEQVVLRRANDILRASGLPALSGSDPGVNKDYRRVDSGKKISPILLISLPRGCIIADGYHRVSLSFNLSPFEMVPCKIAHFSDW